MNVKCIGECEDFYDLTVGKEYKVLETVKGRYMIKDDIEVVYPYPTKCFEIINTNLNPKYKFMGGNYFERSKCKSL